RERNPREEQVEERLVERRKTDRADGGEDDRRRRQADHDATRVVGHTRPGLAIRIRISTENETSGAHAGVTTAIVIDSVTPMRRPASSAPIGFASPPMITTANTTPTHDQICAGASVEI